VWDAAKGLEGDEGARVLLTSPPAGVEVVEVDCSGTGDPTDVDTLATLRALEAQDKETS
jgi:hypothetical protein